MYYPYNRGALLASCVFLYAITAGALCMRRLVMTAVWWYWIRNVACRMFESMPAGLVMHTHSLPMIPATLTVRLSFAPGVAGYISGVQYKLFGGTNWVRNVLLTATLFCGPLLVVFSFLNTVAIIYRVRCGTASSWPERPGLA